MTGATTLIDALSQAGGIKETAGREIPREPQAGIRSIPRRPAKSSAST